MRPSNSLIAQVDSSASFTSQVVYAWDIVRASFQVNSLAGAFNGTLQVQASNQNATGLPPNQFIPTQWSNVSSATVVASSSPSQRSFLIMPIECAYQYLRVTYTPTTAGIVGSVSIMMKAMAL